MKSGLFVTGMLLTILTGCRHHTDEFNKTEHNTPKIADSILQPLERADATTIFNRKEVPILCYHRIKEILNGDSEFKKTYTVTPSNFEAQMKTLSEKGYQSISPDNLYEYLVYGKPLPKKPVMITFDDTHEEHYNIGLPIMEKYGFNGVFFIMTVSINRPNYMTKEQIKILSQKGHAIEAHSWDHHKVTKYFEEDWDIQLIKPKKQLENITGKPVNYFAYPFGLWNTQAISELKKRDYRLGFILSSKRDTVNPLYTVRRMIIPSDWSAEGMLKAMEATFNKKNTENL